MIHTEKLLWWFRQTVTIHSLYSPRPGRMSGEGGGDLWRMQGIYELSSFITSSSLLGIPSLFQLSLCSFTQTIYPLTLQTCGLLSSSFEFTKLSSTAVHLPTLFLFLHSYPFLFCPLLLHSLYPPFFPSIYRCLFLSYRGHPPLWANLPRSMVGYLTGLLREDSEIE